MKLPMILKVIYFSPLRKRMNSENHAKRNLHCLCKGNKDIQKIEIKCPENMLENKLGSLTKKNYLLLNDFLKIFWRHSKNEFLLSSSFLKRKNRKFHCTTDALHGVKIFFLLRRALDCIVMCWLLSSQGE